MFIGVYNISVFFSYLAVISSFFAIYFTINNNILIASLFLMTSGLIDMFDGKLASLFKRNDFEKKFGSQIDTVLDVFNFGAVPIIILFLMGFNSFIDIMLFFVYLFAATMRLAYFNTRLETGEDSHIYLGIPVTAVSLILPLGILIWKILSIKLVIRIFLLVTAILFISNINIKKPSKKSFYFLMISIGLIILLTNFIYR